MLRMRVATLLALCVSGTAAAQSAPAPAPQQAPPAPLPAPQQAPLPAPQQAPQDPNAGDAVLNEQIADQLVTRAQELFDAKMYLDAKQLAVEALVKSPKGQSAERAKYIIKLVNQHLDIKEDPTPTPPAVTPVQPTPANGIDQPDLTPIDGTANPYKTNEAPVPPPQPEGGDARDAALIHGALYGGVIGATIGAAAGGDHPASVAVPVGIAGGVGVGLLGRTLVGRLHWDEAQVRTAGSFSTWGGVVGGLFAEAVTGAGASSPTATGVLLGATIGSTLGLAAGTGFAVKHTLTRGDVALIDTLAGIGTVGGLTLGMLMQPAQREAYSVNSIIGASGGVIVGLVAAPQTNTTPRRMLRVAGLSAAGAAAPFLLYAAIYDSHSADDERVTGLLSSAGLVAGAYLGFRLTRDMDVGLDVQPGKGGERSDDAPAAVVGRSSNGTWGLGGIGMMPLSKQLATNNRGMTFTLVGARF